MTSDIPLGWQNQEEEAAYARLSVPAIFSLLFGLSTFCVFFTPWFFFLGIIAILLSLAALWTIRHSGGTVIGQNFAYLGLGSAVAALTAILLFWTCYQYGIRREADQFFRLWFAAVQEQNIPKAKEMQSVYYYRSKSADAEAWWKEQYAERNAHHAVHKFTDNKLVRVLAALGGQAKVTYYKTLDFQATGDYDAATMVYAVTFPAAPDRTETFFVKINGRRFYPAASTNFTAAAWRLYGTPELYVPE